MDAIALTLDKGTFLFVNLMDVDMSHIVGFQIDAGKFFFFCLTLQIASLAICALVFLISSSVKTPQMANVLLPVVLVLTMVRINAMQ